MSTTSSDCIDWNGATGKTYRYWFLETPRNAASIKNEGGNYALCSAVAERKLQSIVLRVSRSSVKNPEMPERWEQLPCEV